MVTRQEIQTTCDDIVQEFHPLQIILFGSYAYGTPTEDSDVDLLVVMPIPKSEFRNKAVEIRQRIQYHFSMDLLVRSPRRSHIVSRITIGFYAKLLKKVNFFMVPIHTMI